MVICPTVLEISLILLRLLSAATRRLFSHTLDDDDTAVETTSYTLDPGQYPKRFLKTRSTLRIICNLLGPEVFSLFIRFAFHSSRLDRIIKRTQTYNTRAGGFGAERP